MARIEFMRTARTEAAGVAGRTLPLPLKASVGADAKASKFFDTEAHLMTSQMRVVAVLYDVLVRAGSRATFAQTALMVDGSGAPEDRFALMGCDFVIVLEPGDPGYREDDEADAEEDDEADAEEDDGPGPTGAEADASDQPSM